MSDPLSIAASVIGVASAGIKLSTTLYHFTETAINADRHIKDIARDLSITSSVITRFGTLLGEQASQNDGKFNPDNQNIIDIARDAANGCDEVFKDIQRELDKCLSVEYDDDEHKPVITTLKRLKWPLVQPKLAALHMRLERLKNTLVLTLNMATYASRTSFSEIEVLTLGGNEDQRRQIDRLIQMNQEANARYSTLERALQRIESIQSLQEPPLVPFRKDSGIQLSMNSESAVSLSDEKPSFGTVQSSRTFSTISSCACGVDDTTSVRPNDGFHITQDDLSLCADQARLFLKVVEEAKASAAGSIQYEEVRNAYFESFRALKSIFPSRHLQQNQQQKRDVLRRFFLGRSKHG